VLTVVLKALTLSYDRFQCFPSLWDDSIENGDEVRPLWEGLGLPACRGELPALLVA
jgi:hypothetical protein